VLVFSNLFISLTRGFVPIKARIPAYIVIIATFVTIVELLLGAYLPALYSALGLFIPLIVVNCIILARAEGFAAKNSAGKALLDGLGMGLGFTMALVMIGAVRELIGGGTFFAGTMLEMSLPESFPRTVLMVLPPGAFFTLGIIMAYRNHIIGKKGGGANVHDCGVSGCRACE
jgi:electron transport complex protein RnfE